MIGIYFIYSEIQNLYYIGKTINFKKRKWTHISQLTKKIHKNIYLQRSWDKYKEDNFLFRMFYICNKNELNFWEKFYIQTFNSVTPNGFNYTLGGDGGCQPIEIREKIKLKLKGRTQGTETKLKISKALKGRKPSKKCLDNSVLRSNSLENEKHLSEIRKLAAIKNSRHYSFISPLGEIHQIFNLSKFCKNFNLNPSHMSQVYRDKKNHYKKWKKYG